MTTQEIIRAEAAEASDYIERKRVIDLITSRYECPEICAQEINEISAADVAPVVHGRWVYDENATDWGIGGYVCSECKNKNNNLPCNKVKNVHVFSGSKFCPSCGARMDAEKEEGTEMMTEKALTLEQLQKMRGKWVWIVSPDKDLTVSGWAYVGKDHVYTYWEYERDELVGRVVYNICDYGAWLAYKNPSVGNCAEQLMDLVQAYQDGRCVVLPCKIDDEVYVNIMGKTLPLTVTSISWITESPTFKAMHGVQLCFIFKAEDVGKTVFLTREAAQAALEGGTPDAKAD